MEAPTRFKGSLRVIEANQEILPVQNASKDVLAIRKLLTVGKGVREFMYFCIEYHRPHGRNEIKFYVEEVTPFGLHYIEDNDEWEEIATFCDEYVRGIKSEGNDILATGIR